MMNKDIKLKIEEINASILIKNSQSVDINLITEDGYRVKINRIEYGKVFIYTG